MSLSATYEGLYLEEVHEKFNKELIKSSKFPAMEFHNDDNGVIWCEAFSNKRLGVLLRNGVALSASVQEKLFSKSLFTIPPPATKGQEIVHPHHFLVERGGGGEIIVVLGRATNKG